ncbi:hypothetical protein HI802_05855 [Ralstonia solanacearum]|uniref:hypothetical protein n=2 Tax=Ralstonia pseudosolanacearum TaxID=1310165 RepID=UPI0014026FA1|nr:hypothetical protein [Ralstonia pseudosolanacearum]QKL91665.1 hypothetical protein HI802_05855 [Ralstonia solanacearum]QKL96741.1 hypothetical protein HI801_05855 [Ralstonia solanacearum]QLR09850.1 hypothetical protein H1A20_05800 [Ralstonia solanacearum]UNJ30801.1 hypothetical protein MNY32_05710 [Ralstonia pseudosolanacearum]
MSKEDLLEGLRNLERQEKPGSATAQLREIEAEISASLAKGYTLKQVWGSLYERGLKLSFSGFKSSFYRRQQEAKELQKVSNGFDECPHCGGALANQSAEPEAATDSHPAAIAGGKSSAKEVAGEGMGASFARALEERMLSTPLATRRSKP